MAFTGQLGTSDSYLANIVLGTAGGGDLEQIINHVLALVQTANAGQTATAENTLVLVDDAVGTVDHFESASHTLVLVDEAISSITMLSVSDTLALVDLAEGRTPISIAVAQTLELVQVQDGHQNPVNKLIFDDLGLVSQVNRTITVVVSQSMSLVSAVHRFLGGVDVLNLIQSVSVGKSKDGTSHQLTLLETIVIESVLTRSVPDPLGLIQSVTYSVVGDGCALLDYRPYVGSSTDPAFPPPSTTKPTLGDGTLTLTFPFVAPTTTLILRNPEFDNTERLAFNRVIRESRGGSLSVFADPDWPKEDILLFTVTSLRPQKLDALRTFLLDSAGREIGLLDWENRQWKGIVLNPDAAMSEPGRDNRTVSLEFDGELV